MKNRTPKFYYSLRSPYSWLALEDLSSHYSELAAIVQWHPYWDPDDSTRTALQDAGGGYAYAQMSREKHLYILQDVRRLAADRELTVTWPLDGNSWWEVPHLACLAARGRGREVELATALTRARWRDGRDICDPTTVSDVAQMVGLDGVEVSRAVDDPQIRDLSTETLMQAYKDGVFGVPFFVRGTARYWGVERLDAFAALLDVAQVPPADSTAPVPIGSDVGHAGGCG